MTLTVGVMPKSTRNPYFEDCQRGAEEAAKDLGFTLEWDGPPEPDADRQAQIVERWTRNGLPALAVSVESSARLTPALLDARSQGVRVLTWDADAVPEAREFTVVQATPDAVAHALSFEVGRITGGTGAFAVITSTLSAPNQSARGEGCSHSFSASMSSSAVATAWAFSGVVARYASRCSMASGTLPWPTRIVPRW